MAAEREINSAVVEVEHLLSAAALSLRMLTVAQFSTSAEMR